MKIKSLPAIVFLLVTASTNMQAAPLGMAFTYQGRLNDAAKSANGIYDFRFAIYDDSSGPGLMAGPIAVSSVPITNGLFTVLLDFGGAVFNGDARWLEIAVRTNGAASFSTLDSRQPITPTPYAIRAIYANMAASVPAYGITGIIPNAQLSTNVVVLDGSGKVPEVYFSTNVALLNTNAVFVGPVTATAFYGNGGGLTNVSFQDVDFGGALNWNTNWGHFVLASSPFGGAGPWCVTSADVNGDGWVDLVCANRTSNSVAVLTNNGHGAFPSVSIISVGAYPVWVTTDDVNNDGWPDIISANMVGNTLTVLTNNQHGNFGTSSTLATENNPTSVAATDVNSDGWADLICANYGSGTLSILTNTGYGTFIAAPSLLVGNGPESVAAADVNGDGWPDLICANSTDSSLMVLANNPSGDFEVPLVLGVGDIPACATAADINGDGKADLICANYGDNTLTVLINNGSGGFISSSTLQVGSYPSSVIAADVSGDNHTDLICANAGDNTLTVLINNGSGGFGTARTYSVGVYPHSVTAADVNRDGHPDLVSANFVSCTLTVLTNTWLRQVSFTGSGAGLTDLNAGNITSGILSDDRLSTNISRLNGNQTFTGANTFLGPTIMTNPANRFAGKFDGTFDGTFAGDGSGLTNLNATNLVGTIPDARLSKNVALLNGTNIFTGTNIFAGTVLLTNWNNIYNGTYFGNGFGLTNLNATNLVGTIPDARLSTNVALLNGTNRFTGTNIFAGVTTLTNWGNVYNGTYSGNGFGLTNLNATNLIGTIPDARLSTNVALLNGTNLFTGSNIFAGVVTLTNWNNLYSGTYVGNGGGLTNLNPASLTSGSVTAAVNLTNTANTFVGTFTGNGFGLTNLNATNLVGTISDTRLSTNVALLNGTNVFTGTNYFAGVTMLTNEHNLFKGGFVGDGSGLYNLPGANANTAFVSSNQTFTASNTFVGVMIATNITNRIAGTFIGAFAGDGFALTNLNATNLVGTIPATRLSTNVALLAGTNVFTGTNYFAGVARLTNDSNIVKGTFSGDGSGLYNLPGANANTAFVSSNQTFTASNVFVGVVVATNITNQIAGTFTGNGFGLTNLNATNLTGIIPEARLSTNIAKLNGTNVFTGTNYFAGVTRLTNENNTYYGTFNGSGYGLTNLNTANIPLLNGTNTFTGTNVFMSNVGIGLANPTAPLAFANVLGDKIALWRDATGPTCGFGMQSNSFAPNHLQVHTAMGGDIVFGSSYLPSFVETMRIRNVGPGFPGYLGIGTTNPTAPLTFGNSFVGMNERIAIWTSPDGSSTCGLAIQPAGSYSLLQIHASGSTPANAGDIAFGYGSPPSGSFTEAVRIKGNGLVGIGTTNPVAPLSFANSLGEKIALWTNSLGGSTCGFAIQSNPFAPNHLQIHSSLGGDIVFGMGSGANFEECVRMRNGSGYVGIGVTNPIVPLTFGNDFAAEKIALWTSEDSSTCGFAALSSGGGSGGTASLLRVHAAGGSGDEAGDVVLGYGTAPFTEQMRLRGGSGYLGIGTSSPSQQLHVTGRIRMGTWTSDGTTAVYKNNNGDFGIQSSDIRLKKNIVPIESALDKVRAMNGVAFNWTSDAEGSPKTVGLIAQEVRAAMPELTFDFQDPGGEVYFGVHYEKVGALLINAIHEQQAQIEAQAAENAALKAEAGQLSRNIAELKGHLERLERILDGLTDSSQ